MKLKDISFYHCINDAQIHHKLIGMGLGQSKLKTFDYKMMTKVLVNNLYMPFIRIIDRLYNFREKNFKNCMVDLTTNFRGLICCRCGE